MSRTIAIAVGSVWKDGAVMTGRHKCLSLQGEEPFCSNDDLIDTLQSEITRLREEARWIPCSERMPDNYELVLVIARRPKKLWNTADACYAIVGDEECYVTLADYEPSCRQGCAFWRSRISGTSIAVTHWRPLPEPPEVSE